MTRSPRPPGGKIARLLFPPRPRPLPGRRALKILLRAVHVLCAGILVGSHALTTDVAAQSACLLYTALSGAALLGLDLHESGGFLLQVRGLVVLLKIAVVGALPWFGSSAVWVLGGVLMVSVVFSHAPSKVRYFLLLGRGRIEAATSKG